MSAGFQRAKKDYLQRNRVTLTLPPLPPLPQGASAYKVYRTYTTPRWQHLTGWRRLVALALRIPTRRTVGTTTHHVELGLASSVLFDGLRHDEAELERVHERYLWPYSSCLSVRGTTAAILRCRRNAGHEPPHRGCTNYDPNVVEW